jgi:hypothetical protein
MREDGAAEVSRQRAPLRRVERRDVSQPINGHESFCAETGASARAALLLSRELRHPAQKIQATVQELKYVVGDSHYSKASFNGSNLRGHRLLTEVLSI